MKNLKNNKLNFLVLVAALLLVSAVSAKDDFEDVEGSASILFSEIDRNGDNVISKAEFNRAFKKRDKDCEDFISFEELDANKDGKISIKEFDKIQKLWEAKIDKELEEDVNLFMQDADSNKDGFLSEKEFYAAEEEFYDELVSEKQMKKLKQEQKDFFKELDSNKDGKLSKNELKRFFIGEQ